MKEITDEYLQSGLPVFYGGKLCKIVGIAEGKTILLVVLEDKYKDKCPNCGSPIHTEYSLLEHSPLFQNGIKLLKIDEK